uniref:cystathionine beta-synthase n=1 Tax=Ditylenchus dipsaci TaxID=166011 RepID=A0A915D841_9BILA
MHPSSPPPSFYTPQMSTFFEFSPPTPAASYKSPYLPGSAKENCQTESVPWNISPNRAPFKSIQSTNTKNFQRGNKDNALLPTHQQPINRNCRGAKLKMESGDNNMDTGRNASSPRNSSLQAYNPNMSQRMDPSSGISSPVETRREFGMPRQQQHNNNPQPMMGAMHPHMQAGFTLGPPPAATKMLVDPSTGQQYFVPTAQPQVAYYPVYYNAGVAPQSQAVFYQPTQPAPQGYFMGAHQPIPTSPTHQGSQSIFFHSHPESGHHYMRASSPPNRSTPPNQNQGFNAGYGTSPNQPYRVEIPPSTTAGSVCEAQSISPVSYFNRHHESRVSTESAASSASNASSRNKHSDDSMSPHTLSAFTAAAQSKASSSVANKQEQQQQRMPAHQSPFFDRHSSSARYSSTTTSSSSGFASGVGEAAVNEHPRRNDSGFGASRTPAHTWWGEAEQQQQQSGVSPRQINSRCPTSPKSQHHESPRSGMSNKPLNFDSHPSQAAALQRPLAQKSIRMDIDFKRAQSPEQHKEEEVCAKANASRAAPPTAFTVQFDGEEGIKESSKSLQDAARQAPTGRRLMRKANEGSGSDSGQDPKHYLFTKMIQGYNKKTAAHGSNGEEQMSLSTSSNDDKRESDALSEAGTYIVEGKNRRGTCMITSQIIDSEDEEDSDSSTATTISDSIANSSQGVVVAPQRPSSIYPPPSALTTTQNEQKTPVVKRSLMSDLRKLREENSNKPVPAPRIGNSKSNEAHPPGQRLSRVSSAATGTGSVGQSQKPPSRPCHVSQRPATSNATNASAGSNNLFRRGDGGRFSMRSAHNASSSLAKVASNHKGFLQDSSASKPPFRNLVGAMTNNLGRPATKANAVPQETPEMIAWLRRKEYDPRKAAAEARKLQQLKQRDAFISNRSISYHNADGSHFKSWRKPFGDERSNKSHDDLSRLGEETEDFAQLSLAGSSTSLKKTVDELTQKCQKSIELIRLCNKNSLSESVENLLEQVVDSNAPNEGAEEFETSENISNRLERLSSAFDAIQKYLEEQSSGSPASPGNQTRPRAASGSSTSRLLLSLNSSQMSGVKNNDPVHYLCSKAVFLPRLSINVLDRCFAGCLLLILIFSLTLLPLILIGSWLFGCSIFLNIYAAVKCIKDNGEQTPDVWNDCRAHIASAWVLLGRVWHGYEIQGLEHIPDKGPALIIAYHGKCPTDFYFLIANLIFRKKRAPYVVMLRENFNAPGLAKFWRVSQATAGSVEECTSILNDGNLLIIAPGGLKEGLFSKDYEIFWGNRLGFAKVALASNAPIIPMFTENIADSFRVPMILGKPTFPALITHLGTPLVFPPDFSPEEVKEATILALSSLIHEYQHIPGSIPFALAQRCPSTNVWWVRSHFLCSSALIMPNLQELDIPPYSQEAKKECIWHEDGVEDHFGRYQFEPYPKPQKKIYDTVLEAIGNTPLVKLQKIPKEFGIVCNVYGKCEFLSGGGSVKDRIAVRMVEVAEKIGRLKPGMTVIEPTSGNTGIGLALVCAVKGYKCVIVMPSKMSKEKEVTLKALGAKIIRTSDDAKFDSDESHIGYALKLRKETPNSVVLDQYLNCANPMTHYDTTAEEILDALDGKVDMAVIGVGTGGSATGISKKLRKRCSGVKIIGVDPVGSVIGGNNNEGEEDSGHHHFQVEGIGYDFVPTVLDVDMMDAWEKLDDIDTFQMARKLNVKEGILSGGSSGANMMGALRAARGLKAGQNCVVMLPDGVRNYLTKFLSDEWMKNNKCLEEIVNDDQIYPKEPPQSKTNSPYDPEKAPEEEFQKIADKWPQKPFNPERPLLIETMDQAIGNTPMVRLQKIPQSMGIEAEIVVKLEYLNAGGSIKDRIALKMIDMAEKSGVLKPGMTIIEPTSGNTGIGLAFISAIRGYKCIIVMPSKMSKEKEVTLKALGATIVRTPAHHKYNEPESHIGVALRLQKETPNSIILDQYRNMCNPLAHYEGTAEEILYACDEKVDAIVIGAGTGGTVTGVAKKFKERVPDCEIIATDPFGSLLADPAKAEIHHYEVEGVGYDFVPAVLDRSLVKEWVKTDDADSFTMARRLIREEGLMCGGSSGANVWAALQIAKRFKKGDRIVVILPDGIRNYMTKFLDDDWMKSKGFPVEESTW